MSCCGKGPYVESGHACGDACGPVVGTDTVVFWDEEGVEILSITSQDIGLLSDVLCDIFDTPANRAAIEKASGRKVDNTSEETFEGTL